MNETDKKSAIMASLVQLMRGADDTWTMAAEFTGAASQRIMDAKLALSEAMELINEAHLGDNTPEIF